MSQRQKERTPRLRKGLGQHLLRDRRAAGAIVAALDPRPGEPVLEIGPGLGALTEPLLAGGARVVAVEADGRLADELVSRYAGGGGLDVLRCDILEVSLAAICRERDVTRIKVIGNIPYNITTPILLWLIEQATSVERAVLTIQREVADRLLAAPGNKSYGSITLFLRQRAEVRRVRDIKAGAFLPPPKVDSTVVSIVPRARPAVEVPSEPLLEALVRRSFGQRRKMLRSSLSSRAPWSREDLEEAARRAGVSLASRPEELPLEAFGSLCRALYGLGHTAWKSA